MRVIDPGHSYRVMRFDDELKQEGVVKFVKRMGAKYPGNDSAYSGTTTQELLRVLIDRAKYVDKQEPHIANRTGIELMREYMTLLELRAAKRHGRLDSFVALMETADNIEDMPTCNKCGHIGCEGNCHANRNAG